MWRACCALSGPAGFERPLLGPQLCSNLLSNINVQVYCQPIQYGVHIAQRTTLPYDTIPLAPYAWQPDYFEADLCPQHTTAAAAVPAAATSPAAATGAAAAAATGSAADAVSETASEPAALTETGPAAAVAAGQATATEAGHAAVADAAAAPAETEGARTGAAAAAATQKAGTARPAAALPQSLSWKPLAAPQPVFSFDFNTPDPLTAFQPAEQRLQFEVTSPGVWNAVAFWFELRLDEHTTLSSSPYAAATAGAPSTTWKQVSKGGAGAVLLAVAVHSWL